MKTGMTWETLMSIAEAIAAEQVAKLWFCDDAEHLISYYTATVVGIPCDGSYLQHDISERELGNTCRSWLVRRSYSDDVHHDDVYTTQNVNMLVENIREFRALFFATVEQFNN
jgi:hypothetical protein